MAKGLMILTLIVIFFWLVWPAIVRWMKRKALQKLQDNIYRSMGMEPPPRKGRGSKKKSRQDSRQQQRRRTASANEPIIPKEYAEDVDFVEIKEYSETTVETHKASSSVKYHESQVSDAEWVEIKSSRSNPK